MLNDPLVFKPMEFSSMSPIPNQPHCMGGFQDTTPVPLGVLVAEILVLLIAECCYLLGVQLVQDLDLWPGEKHEDEVQPTSQPFLSQQKNLRWDNVEVVERGLDLGRY